MCSGVSKSGSPDPKPQTSIPWALSARAFAEIARVADGAMPSCRRASRIVGASGGRDAIVSSRWVSGVRCRVPGDEEDGNTEDAERPESDHGETEGDATPSDLRVPSAS